MMFRRRGNPPGLDEIAFRLAIRPRLLRWMQEQLPRSGPSSDDPAAQRNALDRLNPDDEAEFVPALFDAWAAVGDVLSFYQERIANEGYLRTATESFSLLELIRAIDYRRKPALSAQVWLAFTLIDARPRLEKLNIPPGSAVQSVPLPGQTPVIFETSQQIEARPQWNAMSLLLPGSNSASRIVGGATQIRVARSGAAVRSGAVVLFSGDAPQSGGSTVFVRSLSAAETEADGAAVLLNWSDPLPGSNGDALLESPEIAIFRQQGKLFGAVTPDWALLPQALQARVGERQGDAALAPFQETGRGLPAGDVSAFAITTDSTVFAAVGEIILRHDAVLGWITLGTMPTRSAVTALVAGEDGRLYAGTARGEVFCSIDGGQWFALQGTPSSTPVPDGEALRLPIVPVKALALLRDRDGKTSIAAGTPIGLWRVPLNGGNWVSWNQGLPGCEGKQGASVSIAALVQGAQGRWIAATDHGLFRASPAEGGWSLVSGADKVRALLSCPGMLLAAASQGLLQSADGGLSWRPLAGPAGTTCFAAGKDGILAGTPQGLFRSPDQGRSWVSVSGLFAAQAVTVLAAQGGVAAAAAPFSGYREPSDSQASFASAGGKTLIRLDRPYPAIAPDSWIVLRPDDAGLPAVACRVAGVSITSLTSGLSRKRVTEVSVDAVIEPMDPRTATVFLQSQLLEIQDGVPSQAMVLTGNGMTAARSAAGAAASNLAIPAIASQADSPIRLNGAIPDLAGRHVSISGSRAAVRLSSQTGGVRVWDNEAAAWTLMGSGNHNTLTLLVTRDDAPRLFLGGQVDVRCFLNGEWVAFGHLQQVTNKLIEDPSGAILAATEAGLWRGVETSGAGAWSCLGLAGRRVLSIAYGADGVLWAGTDGGLFSGGRDGAAWTEMTDFSGVAVTALIGSDHGAIAGTGDGRIAVCTAGSWQIIAADLPVDCINDLAADGKGRICAATNHGLFQSEDDGLHWTAVPDVDAALDIRALGIDPSNGDLWLAVHGQGVLRAGQHLRAGVANEVRSFAFYQGKVVAGSLFSATLLQIGAPKIADLAEPVFLSQFADQGLGRALADGAVSSDLLRIFASHGIIVPPSAKIRVVSEGATWMIGSDDAATAYLVYAMGSGGAGTSEAAEIVYRIFVSSDLEVLEQPASLPGKPDFELWKLRTQTGVRVTLIAGKGQLDYRPANASCENVAEICKIAGAPIADDRTATTLILDPPLVNVYDAGTVTVNANVAPATHGESPVMYEVIGSGDNGAANQIFTLKQRPVTALAATQEPFYRYDITVRIRPSQPNEALSVSGQLRPRDIEEEGLAWRQVDDLIASGPQDTDYSVSIDDDGVVSLAFGDGIHGKRLPTGTGNVTALYRIGSGPDGNVSAGQLTMLRKRPPGVGKVTNPVAAEGGVSAEDPEAMRWNAPRAIRTCGRLVSCRDYEDFSLAWPGVGKVTARQFGDLIHLSIAKDDGVAENPQALHPQSAMEVYADLLAALRANAARRCKVQIDHVARLWFNMTADLVADPAFDSDAVLEAARNALTTLYGFDRRELGEPVRIVELTAALQGVPGVRAVYPRELFLLGHRPALGIELAAPLARRDRQARIQPAALLQVNEETSPSFLADGSPAAGRHSGLVLRMVPE